MESLRSSIDGTGLVRPCVVMLLSEAESSTLRAADHISTMFRSLR